MKLVAVGVVIAGLVSSGVAGSFSAYAQAAPLPNYFTGQVTVPSAGSAQQAGEAFNSQTYVINYGPLGYYQLTQNNGYFFKSGSVAAGTYNYEVEVVPDTGASGFSVVTISW